MKRKIILFLSMFVAVFFMQASFACFARVGNDAEKKVPRIDDEAAYCERSSFVSEEALASKEGESIVYPQNFWMFLFGAYIFLMIFNLSFDFGKRDNLQWFWEAALTFLAIFVWDNLDVARVNSWFPGVILETGIIIYGFYFYFFREKIILQKK